MKVPSVITAILPEEVFQRRDHGAVIISSADCHAQRISKAVARGAAHDDAFGLEEGVGVWCGMRAACLEMNEHEVADAFGHFESECPQLSGRPRQPFVVMRDRFLDVRFVGNGSGTGRDRGG